MPFIYWQQGQQVCAESPLSVLVVTATRRLQTAKAGTSSNQTRAACGQNIPSSSDQQQLTEAILAQQETRSRCLVDIEPKMEERQEETEEVRRAPDLGARPLPPPL